MIYFTILSEIASHVLKHPKDFKSLFTDKDTKQNIIIVDPRATEGGLNIQTLRGALRKKVINKELYQLVCDLKFASDDSGAHEARCMAFCEMGIPYYNYLTTLCGIKSVDIQGACDDWKKLVGTLNRLRSILAQCNSDRQVTSLIDRSIQTVTRLIHFTFDQQTSHSREEFFNDIFHYGQNHKCGSGHDQFIVSGWIRNFYLSQGEDITNFSSSMTYVPYFNNETQRKFVQVSTIAYSELVDGTAVPHYGKLKFEIFNEALFNKIAMKNDQDPLAFMF